MESAAACTGSRALRLRDPTRMVSLVRCTMSLDAAPHGFWPKIQHNIAIKVNKPKTRRIGFLLCEASLSGAHVSARARKRYRKSAAPGPHLSSVIANPHHRTRARPSERKHSTCIASLIPAIPQIRAMARRWTSCALACVAVSAFAPRTALRPKTTIPVSYTHLTLPTILLV